MVVLAFTKSFPCMCIFCIASDAIYSNKYNYKNNINIKYRYKNKGIREITGRPPRKPGLIHRLWKKMCTPFPQGCAQTVDYL